MLNKKTVTKNVSLTALIALLTACGGGGGGGNSVETTSTDPLEIVFLADKDTNGKNELYHTNSNGTIMSRLSGPMIETGDVLFSKVSPNRQYVAYLANQDSDGLYELYVASLAGSIKVSGAFSTGTMIQSFTWAPDSSRLIYSLTQEMSSDDVIGLHTVRPDGSENINITNPLALDEFIEGYSWAPDSNSIAYLINKSASLVSSELHTIAPDGSNDLTIVDEIVGGDISHFQWSPNGQYIAYTADATIDGAFELLTIRSDGTDGTTASGFIAADRDVSDDFMWAPNNSYIAYRADQDNDNRRELYTSTPNGSENNKVADVVINGDVKSFAWAPDSTRIAYRADQETNNRDELFTTTPNGSDNSKVSSEFADEEGDVAQFKWAPDSSRVAYLAHQDANQVNELYTATPQDNDNTHQISDPAMDNGSDVTSFEWAPDSSRLAYIADIEVNSRYELYTSTSQGPENNIKISGDLADGKDVFDFEWQSDNNALIYISDQNTDSIIELFSAQADTSDSGMSISGTLTPNGDVHCANEGCEFQLLQLLAL